MLLAEYDIVYMARKTVKGSTIAYHLTYNVIEDYEPLNFDLPDEGVLAIEDDSEINYWWTMYFNVAVNISRNEAEAIIISLEKKQYPVLLRLQFEYTNNTTKYKACIINLEVVLKLDVEKLDVYGDSMLIIYQVKGE